jgi:hypothetical protein
MYVIPQQQLHQHLAANNSKMAQQPFMVPATAATDDVEGMIPASTAKLTAEGDSSNALTEANGQQHLHLMSAPQSEYTSTTSTRDEMATLLLDTTPTTIPNADLLHHQQPPETNAVSIDIGGDNNINNLSNHISSNMLDDNDNPLDEEPSVLTPSNGHAMKQDGSCGNGVFGDKYSMCSLALSSQRLLNGEDINSSVHVGESNTDNACSRDTNGSSSGGQADANNDNSNALMVFGGCGGSHLPTITPKGVASWRHHVMTTQHQKWMEEH